MTNKEAIEETRKNLIRSGAIKDGCLIKTKRQWLNEGYKIKKEEKPIAKILLWLKNKDNYIKKYCYFYSEEQIEK